MSSTKELTSQTDFILKKDNMRNSVPAISADIDP